MKIRSSNRKLTGDGFSIVELLLVLAISGMLLAAVALAFNASVINLGQDIGLTPMRRATNAAFLPLMARILLMSIEVRIISFT